MGIYVLLAVGPVTFSFSPKLVIESKRNLCSPVVKSCLSLLLPRFKHGYRYRKSSNKARAFIRIVTFHREGDGII